MNERRMCWLLAGTLLGMAISYYCPQEPAYAETASAGQKFAMCTANTVLPNGEAVFVLDMLTGRLIGAGYNTQAGGFTNMYARNLAADFKVLDNAQYVMVSGTSNLRSTGAGLPPATGVLYVGELNSGLVNMYGYAYGQGNRTFTNELQLVGSFPWRQAAN